MIPYEELCQALASWRVKNGLPTAAPPPPAPPAAVAVTMPPPAPAVPLKDLLQASPEPPPPPEAVPESSETPTETTNEIDITDVIDDVEPAN